MAKRNNTTLYILLLTSFKVLLNKYSNQDKIWVATPYARRNTKTLYNVGFYANTLYIDGDLSENPVFTDFLQQVSQKFQESIKYKDISFSQLSELMKKDHLNEDKNYANTMFNFQNHRNIKKNNLGAAFLGIGGARGKIGSLEFEVYPLKRNITQFEIELEGLETDEELHFRLIFDPDKYPLEMIERFTSHYIRLLEELMKNENTRTQDINLLSKEEMTECLTVLNKSNPVQKEPTCSIIKQIEDVAIKSPHSLAVTMGDKSITYEELIERANRVAQSLASIGIKPEQTIGLALTPSVETIVGILGIIKAGAVYVPLDLSYPAERIQYMVQDADISYIICDGKAKLNHLNSKLLYIEQLLECTEMNVSSNIHHGQMAYIIYTSGSTGKPKGVMVSHENIYHSTMARHQVYKTQGDCNFLLLSSISFDSSLVGIFWTLSIGGNIVLSKEKSQLDIPQLLNVIKKEKITHILSVPSLVQLLLKEAKTEMVQTLECVMVAGEQFPKKLQNYQEKYFPFVNLFNEYGPTEGTVWSSYYPIIKSNLPVIPIGFPAGHAQLFLLDKSLNPVPKGTIGEIYIAGQGVARGYNNRPSLTAECFIPNPFGNGDRLYRTGDLAKYNEDGTIQFIGRKDGQIKLNGFRIEVAEIEAILDEIPTIFKSVVLVKKETETAKLIAYISTGATNFQVEDIRNVLYRKLPYYMIPPQFIVLSELPLTQNGKVDIKQLQTLKSDEKPASITLPSSSREKELVLIFQEVFNEKVGVDHNFFEIGGDSILAIQLSSKANERGWVLKPKDIFERKTIKNMALCMQKSNYRTVSREKFDGEFSLTPIQKWFFEQDFLFPNHWNQAIRLKIRKDLPFSIFKEAFQYLLNVHDSFRLRFFLENNDWRQEFSSSNQELEVNCIELQESEYNEIFNHIEKLQNSLDITKGPSVKAAYFNLKGDMNDEIVVIAHHLVVDMVSWQILLQDLDTLIKQLLAGEEMSLPAVETSYKEWAIHLSDSSTEIINQEMEYWDEFKKQERGKAIFKNKGTEGSRKTFELALDKEASFNLLKEVPKYYGTKIHETILSAVVLSLKTFTKDHGVQIDMESHGRNPIHESLDLSRTVGWFTSIYPLYFNESKLISADGELLKYVKNTVRELPSDGLGYGLARWFSDESVQLKDVPGSLYSFNYLGRVDQTFFHSNIFDFHSYLSDTVKNNEEKRLYLLDFEPYVKKDQLYSRINYSSDNYTDKEIENLALDILNNMRELITFCCKSEDIGYVASEFPEANLNQNSLDKFLSSFKHNGK